MAQKVATLDKYSGAYLKVGAIEIRFCSISNTYIAQSNTVKAFPVALNTLEMMSCPVDRQQMELWRISYHLINGLRSSLEVLQDSSNFRQQNFLAY
jgi:hypothetical protein